MNFNKHLPLQGKHAFLGASKYNWVNYESEEQLLKKLCADSATEIGTILHNYAAKRIQYSLRLNKNEKKAVLCELLRNRIPRVIVDSIDFDSMYDNLMVYVNECINFRMEPEVVLYYSDNCFGTTDAISFQDNLLRIHDLKTGTTPAHMEQLEIYAALFCLEYRYKPKDIDMELRIYQSNNVTIYNPEPKDILAVADKIVQANKFLESIRE